MKTKSLNFNLTWESKRKHFIEKLDELNFQFPSYNILVKNQDNLVINTYQNLTNHIPQMEKIWKGVEDGYVCPRLEVRVNNSLCLTEFKYDFINNYSRYKQINDKVGFFKKVNVVIDYNENDTEDFNIDVEYEEINDIEKNKLFQKVYRSSDYLSVKIMLDKSYLIEKEISSILIISEASNRTTKNKKLKNLFINNIQDKYLDINDQSVLLTVPFIESDLVELTENINISIVCLNKLQSDMYELLTTKESEDSINLFYQEFFPNQYFNIGKIYRQNTNNETILFYQNYFYLFNKESFDKNCEKNNRIIDQTTFNGYFPLLNKDRDDRTVCLSDDLNTDNVLDNNFNLDLNYLGYYGKDLTSIEDVAIDLDYFQKKNILSAKIIDIEEADGECSLSIEFITNLFSNERLYIESSQNIKYIKKYKTLIDEKEYITILFKYFYSLDLINQYIQENPNINKNQIIFDKDLINFSAKLIL